MRKRESVYCARCQRRYRRVWDDERGDGDESCYYSSYGVCQCGGNLFPLETLRRWKKFDFLFSEAGR